MPKKKSFKTVGNEVIELRRGDQIVTSFFGAFGNNASETRLTAALGYLISLSPDAYLKFFGFKGTVRKVTVEARHDQDRSDIYLETSLGRGVIEAKVDATDASKQVQKYPADFRAVLTAYPKLSQSKGHGTRFRNWRELVVLLQTIRMNAQPFEKYLINEFIKYLEEQHMARAKDPVEVYAREVRNRETVELFLKGRIYGCDFQKDKYLAEAVYFMPHFGKAAAREIPGIGAGLSYVAKIEDIGVVESFAELVALVRKERGKGWYARHQSYIEPLRKTWKWKNGKRRSILLLGDARLLFNPPVRKVNLQKGSGWLSRRAFSFDTLIAAWSGIKGF